MPSAGRHWAEAWEGGGGGAPSQKTCRSPSIPDPLVEGGIVRQLLIATVVAALLAVTGAASGSTAPFPHRIVSLSPTATESLFAVGAGAQVIAVDDQSDYPKEAPRTKLSGFTPNVEAIAKYRPDLVVISNDVKSLRSSLTKLH